MRFLQKRTWERGGRSYNQSGGSSNTDTAVNRPFRTVAVRECTRAEVGHRRALRTSGRSTDDASSSGAAAGHSPTARVASESFA